MRDLRWWRYRVNAANFIVIYEESGRAPSEAAALDRAADAIANHAADMVRAAKDAAAQGFYGEVRLIISVNPE